MIFHLDLITDAAGGKLHSVWQKSGEDMRQDNSQ